DFVANKIGGYAGNATFHDLWEIFQTNYSVHSSGGTAALGSDSNHVDKEKLFSYEGLDIKDMNAKRQGRTIGLLQQWQKTPSPENPVATQLTQLQRLLWQSGQWQQQLDNTSGLLTRPTPTTPDAPSARQQQLQQLRHSLTPY
ncbi:hemagglutinin, partial [Xylella fastidiosa]